MPIGSRRTLLAAPLIPLVFLVAITFIPSDTHANGRVTEFIRQVAGPYEIALGTVPGQPTVGPLHITMTVTEASSDNLVLDAGIVVTGIGPEPETGSKAVDVEPIAAQLNVTLSGFYDVNISVDRVGAWTFKVDVTSGLGDASTEFAIDVKKATGAFRLLTWVTVVIFFAVVGLGLLPMIRHRTRRSPRNKNV